MHRTLQTLGSARFRPGGVIWIRSGRRGSSFRRPFRAGEVDGSGRWPAKPRRFTCAKSLSLVSRSAGVRPRITSCCSSTARARRRRSRSMCRTKITAGWRISHSAGFDVFSMDMTGYGRSTRPTAMDEEFIRLEGATGAIRAPVDRRAVCPLACNRDYDHGFRLERHGRRRGSSARVAWCRQGVDRRVVARWAAIGGVCR